MPEQKLNRTLGLAECVFFGVGSILGAGIYALIGKVAGSSGYMLWLSFMLASLTAALSAFSYAELSASIPKSGGEFNYAKEAFGKTLGLILGFIISLNGTISGAAVSLGFAGYFSELFSSPLVLSSLGIILLIYGINVIGIRQSSTVNIVFTIIEVSGLGLAVYSAAPSFGGNDFFELPDGGYKAIFTGAALSFFAYIGFEEIVKLAEETKNPGKTMPRALFIASLIVFVVYTIVAIFSVSAIPPDELGESESPLARVVETRFGQTGVIIISVIALFATANTILSNMLGSSRVIMNMGRESKTLHFFSKVFEKTKTPIRSLSVILLVMIAFSLIGDLRLVAMIANFFIFITFLVINSAVIALRFKKPEMDRPYKIPLSIGKMPLPPVLAILFTLGMIFFTVRAIMEGITI